MEWLHVAFLFGCFVLLSSAQEVVEVKIEPLPERVEMTPRIVGGKAINIEKYPFIVQVSYFAMSWCGGSLITSRHVLTAAHCFVNETTRGMLNYKNFYVRAGSEHLSKGGSIRKTIGLIIHERYNNPHNGNDIAVMMLHASFTFSATIRQATLPKPGIHLKDNTTVWHIGWGIEEFGNTQLSSLLNEVQVFTINNDVCRARYLELEKQLKISFPVTENNLCSGVLDVGGKDACQGDSGGPLVYAGRFVVGVTAWGHNCAEAQYPGVNMRTSAYTVWIKETIYRLNARPALDTESRTQKGPDTKASAGVLLTLLFTEIYLL